MKDKQTAEEMLNAELNTCVINWSAKEHCIKAMQEFANKQTSEMQKAYELKCIGYDDLFKKYTTLKQSADEMAKMAQYRKDLELTSNVELEQKPVESEWISVKYKNLSHLKEGDCVLTLDVNGNIIPYKFFLEGLNMIGDHSDNNQRITHWMPLPSPPIQTK
jgi:hypothetical protein